MNTKELGKAIRRRRKELAIDQQTLADIANISVHTISDIESGKGNPTVESLNKILAILGLELFIRAQQNTGNIYADTDN